MTEIAGITLAVLTLAYIGFPLFRKSRRVASYEVNHQPEDLRARKQELFAAISDLDLDYQMGKLSKDDYDSLRAQYKSEAIAAMKDLDALTMSPVQRPRSAGKPPSANRFCHHCGAPAVASDKFCSDCGESLT